MKTKFYLIAIMLLAVSVMPACEKENKPEPETEFYLKLNPDKAIEFIAQGGTVTVTVDTNHKSWTAESDSDWCKCGVSAAEGKFTVSAGVNTAVDDRYAAVVTVTAGAGDNKIIKTITVTQKGTGQQEEDPGDLSAKGTSNCYIVASGGSYSFDATIIGNGAAGIVDAGGFHTSSPDIAPVSAALLWQDRYADGAGFITSVEYVDGRVAFEVSDKFTAANAVIAVYDGENAAGNLLWSWHIWMPAEAVSAAAIETGYEVMNMNIGAYSDASATPDSFGMLYQWGRKDPFPAADVLSGNTSTVGRPIYDMDGNAVNITNSNWTNTDSNTLAFSIANPTVCLSNMAQSSASKDWLKADTGVDALWGNPNGDEKDGENNYINKGTKSIYDPCPVGWRVPPADVFRRFTVSGGYTWANGDDTVPDFNVRDTDGNGTLDIADYDYGWFFMLNGSDYSYFPAAARFDGSYAMLMGSMTGLWGSYWGNTPNGDGGFAVLSFQTKDMGGNKAITASPSGSAARADAYSVRCIAE